MNSSSESMAVNGGVLSAVLDEAVAKSLLRSLLNLVALTGLLTSSAVRVAFLFRVKGDVVEDGEKLGAGSRRDETDARASRAMKFKIRVICLV